MVYYSKMGTTPRRKQSRTPNGERREKTMANIIYAGIDYGYSWENDKATVIVEYETGTTRRIKIGYGFGSIPKTVREWLEKNAPRTLGDIEAIIDPFGMSACMSSVSWDIEVLGIDPSEMLKEFRHRAETDVLFNKTMITALEQYMEEHGMEEEPEEPEEPEISMEVQTPDEILGEKYDPFTGFSWDDEEPDEDEEEPEDLPQIEEEQDERSDLQRECDAVVTELTNVYEGRLIADEDGCVDGVDFGLCEGDTVSMWDLFSNEDVYDIEYMIGGDGEYRGVRLMVACGGPNVYINTQRREVEGYWSLDSATAWLPSEICEEIDEVWSEYYSMMRG